MIPKETTLHIELTNRCTLKCPACPRTVWQELVKVPVKKADLDMDSLWYFLDCSGGHNIDTFLLCGDYGDPIYYPNLLNFIKKFRSKKFQIVTNGSYMPVEFWKELSSLLTNQDRIIFSIDGLEENNHLYRVNSDWTSIMLGLKTMINSPAQVVWKTLVFNYNYNQLEQIKSYAESLGAEFVAQKTHRFDNCEHLRPVNNAVETNHEYIINFSSTDQVIVEPACVLEKIVTSDGYFFPCDFIRNPKTLYKSQLWKQKSRWIDKLSIDTITFDQGLDTINDWASFVYTNSVENNGDVDVLCKMKCRAGCRQNSKFNI